MGMNGCVLFNDAVDEVTELTNLAAAFALSAEVGDALRHPFMVGCGRVRVFVMPHRLRVCEECGIVPAQPFVEMDNAQLRCWCIEHAKTAVCSPIENDALAFMV